MNQGFTTQRMPPSHIEAERALLGGLLLNPDAFDDISGLLHEENFFKPGHQKIFKAIQDLRSKAESVDPITVCNLLETKRELESVGGQAYIAELMNAYPIAGDIESYARIIRDKFTLRKVILVGSEMIDRSYTGQYEDVESFVDEIESRIYKLSEDQVTDGPMASADLVKVSISRLTELAEHKGETTGLGSGFKPLDRMTAGFHPGELTIIAARPSMGKTAFSLNIAQHVAMRERKSVLYFSIEMGRDSLMNRVLASEARVNLSDLRTGQLTDVAWHRLLDRATRVAESQLFIDDSSTLNPLEVRSKARKIKAKYGLDMIMIDYLQMMRLAHRVESREREVSEISRSLKAVAKELHIPVIALAQVNRSSEGRSDRRPQVADLRESGSIEQDADLIMMLYREDYYDRENPEIKGMTEVIIGKQRNGPTGVVRVKFDSSVGRFSDVEETHPPENTMAAPPKPQGGYRGARRSQAEA